MRVILKIFSVIAILCTFSFAQKETIQFNHLTSQDGLAANTVFCIIQDQKRFIWVGTWDGLNRYDGYNFKVYKTVEGDTTSISDNKIRALCEDKEGNLWIGTWYNGLNKYDSKTEKFTRYIHKANDSSSISSNQIISICADRFGNIWIGTAGGGLNKFDVESEKFIHYNYSPEDPTSLSDNTVFAVYEGREGILWVGTEKGGLNKFDRKNEKFTSFKYNPSDSKSISSNWVLSFLEDRSGNFWIGTSGGGLNKFDRVKNKFFAYTNKSNDPTGLCDNIIWTISEDIDGILWLGTENGGLITFNTSTEEFTCYRKNYYDPKGLNDNTVYSSFRDRSGVLWLGTWNGGINQCNKFKKKFTTYSHNPDNPNSLSGNSVYAIYKDKFGELWVGTDLDGLNRIDEKRKKITRYTHNPDNPFSISNNTINSICEDSFGNLWIATDGGGLDKFDRNRNRFIHFKHNPNDPYSLSSNRISQIFLDRNGALWIGVSGGGIDMIAKGETSITHYRHYPGNPKSISPDLVYALHEDKLGNLWIGTNGGGLNMFERETKEFINYKNIPDDQLSLSYNVVSVIHEDQSGVLWIGTSGGGLNKFDRDKKQFKRYREKDGLSNDMICGLLEDHQGNLWISTNKGLSRFNPKTETFRNYTIEDGLQGNEFNNWAYFKSTDGKMYFGGTDGFNVFHPDSLKDNIIIPQIVITDFQLLHKPVSIGYDANWDRTILTKSITQTSLLELNHDDNIISFEFAALDFQNPEKNRYSYFLEGFDKDWNYTTASRRFVTYTNLDPGEYTLRVKGSNNDGVWNEAGTSLKIIIKPPWWATWWSYFLYGISFILVVIGVRGYDLKRQRLKHQLELEQEHTEKLEEVDRMKTRFFANISHEFRTPLTLILGPAEKIISDCPDENLGKQAGLIKRNANRLLALINQLLDLSKLEAGKLKLIAGRGNIASFVKGVAMTFESIAERKDIALKVILEKENIEAYFDKDKMEQILINVISNAFKFTNEGGKISVRVTEGDRNSVEILVRDSGIGIPKNELPKIFDRFYQVDGSHTREHEGTGIGLALTKELVELHKGEIQIDSIEGEWTEVKISFPLGKRHLSENEIAEPIKELNELVKPEEEYPEKIPSEITLEKEHADDRTIVLIVEDNAEVREYIKDSICTDYHIEEAMNGEQGLRKAEKLIPDLIVSDIMMPKMDGNEMTRRLKNDEKTCHIPIILLTAKSGQDSKLEGLELGADAYITKPFSMKELQVRIKSLIDVRRRLQEKFSKGEYLAKPEENLSRLGRAKAETYSKLDEKYMSRLMEVINAHLSEEEFSIEEIGEEVGMSRAQIYRKLKALTGKSPSLFLRTIRLSKARQMIQNKEASISEIAYLVGFSSPAYFSRCFREEFGHTPSEIK